MHRFLEGLTAPLHISHRGGAKLYPENTLHAFREAVDRWHTDVLELDVHATADGEVVVAHDPTVDRCTDGSGAIAEMTLAQVQRLDAAARFSSLAGTGIRVPRFDEVLHAFPRVRMNVEVKVASAIEPFVKLVTAANALHRLCIGSESDEVAAALHTALPHACHFYPANAAASFVLAGEDDPRFTVLDLPYQWETIWVFTPELKAKAAAAGKWVNVWTVDDPQDMRKLVADGVGGVMTDRPDVLREVLSAMKR